MGRVGIEIPAPVGAQFLDCLLRGDRSAVPLLGVARELADRVNSGEVLDDPAGDQDERATTESGRSTRVIPRTRSAQKLPSSPVREPVKPRTRATATAMPTAAETKFCTARPPVCTRWPIACSP